MKRQLAAAGVGLAAVLAFTSPTVARNGDATAPPTTTTEVPVQIAEPLVVTRDVPVLIAEPLVVQR